MLPAAAVSGLYFAGAPSVYFAGAALKVSSHCSAPMLARAVQHIHCHRMCRCSASSWHPQASPSSSRVSAHSHIRSPVALCTLLTLLPLPSKPSCLCAAVGKITADQVENYAKRKGQELEVTQKWLSPMLKYADCLCM